MEEDVVGRDGRWDRWWAAAPRRRLGAREALLGLVAATALAVGLGSSSAASIPEVQVLTTPTPAEFVMFGRDVAVSGDTMVVSEPGDPEASEGVAHVYVRTGGVWRHAATLRPSAHTFDDTSDFYGQAVAIDGDTIAVSAPYLTVGAQVKQGAVFVYVRPTGGWTDMTETARLTGSGQRPGAFGGFFGTSLAMSGDTILVGSPLFSDAAGAFGGAAYFFVRPPSGWVSTTETARMVAPSAGANDWFGQTVALDGDTAAVGAPGDTLGLGPDHHWGAVYVIERSPTGWSSASPPARLVASDGADYDDFGGDVALADGALAVASRSGVYLFARDAQGGWPGTESARPVAMHLGGPAVALSSDRLLVSSYGLPAPLVFARGTGGWPSLAEPDTLAPSGAPFVDALAVSGTTAVGAASLTAVDGNRVQGAVFVFSLAAGAPAGTAPPSGGDGGGSGGGGGGSSLPDLGLSLTADRTTVAVGDVIALTATVTLKNPMSSSGAGNLVLTHVLPPTLEPVAVTTNRGSCANGQTVTCALGFIASGLTAQVRITARVTGTGEIVTTATVGADETELDPTDNTATVRLVAPAAPLAPPAPRKPAGSRGIARTGTARAETLRGTAFADVLDGRGGDDTILGLAGSDTITGGGGSDTIDAGAGNDTIRARDGTRDVVRCGPGADTVTADRVDVLAGCETVRRR